MRYFRQRLIWSALLLGLAIAQGSPRAQEFELPPASSFIDEKKIDQMATAYIAIEEIRTRATAELAKAEDQQGAMQIIQNAQHAIVRAVERTGLDLREFNRLSELAELDPTLNARIVARVKERQPI